MLITGQMPIYNGGQSPLVLVPKSPKTSLQTDPIPTIQAWRSMSRLFLLLVLFLDLTVTLAVTRSTPVKVDVIGSSLGNASAPSSSVNAGREPGLAGSPEATQDANHHHRASDKSIAGAEVILGGLASAVLGAIFAYIRVTRKQSPETKA